MKKVLALVVGPGRARVVRDAGAGPGQARWRRSTSRARSPSARAPARRPSPTSTARTSGSASPSTWSRSWSSRRSRRSSASRSRSRRRSPRRPRASRCSASNAVDLIAGTMTDTPQRRDSVDFSLTFFCTGAQFLVKKGSPISGIKDIAGKRIAAQQGSTNAKILREKVPAGAAARVPRPAGRLPGAAAGPGRRLHQRRHPALRAQVQGAEPGRLGGRRRLLLLGALRHGHAEERRRVQGGGRRRPEGRLRVGQVLRDLREVVRPQGRAAVSRSTRPGRRRIC